MADPLSIGASVLAFIGLADRIIRACKYCIDAVEDAPKDIQMILGEVTSLKAIIDSISESSATSLVPDLFGENGPINSCQHCLSSLQALLPKGFDQPKTANKRKLTLVELAWPLKQSKVRKLLAEVSHHKATLLLAISGDMSRDLKDMKIGIKKLQTTISDSETREIIRWLECTNPSSLHNIALKKHEPLTTTWMTGSSEWKNWLSQGDRLLWIYGLPGSGKTVLASYVIEELERLCSPADNRICSYYYCHYSHNQDETMPFLSWTIGHVCRQIRWVPPEVKDLHDRGCEPTMAELEEVLEMILRRLKILYIVIDAVDESSPRDNLLALIGMLTVDKRFQKIRILATSRQYFDIEQSFAGISTSISMSNPMVDADIRRFVHARLRSSHRLKRWQNRFEEIENVLCTMAQGMFRWVECQIQSIERLRDQSRLQQLLLNLPRDLSETYVRIFESIPEEERQFVRRILFWIIGHSHSNWLYYIGVNAELLLSAVTYEHFEFEPRDRPSPFDLEYMRETCSCLITIRNVSDNLFDGPEEQPATLLQTTATDGEDLYISLAHYTVLEFLVSPHILQTNAAFFAMPENLVGSQFAAIVLKQALAADPKAVKTDWIHDREAYCLTLGSALYMKDVLADAEVQDLFLQYLNPSNPHYCLFEAIQSRIILSLDNSSIYYLRHIATRVHWTAPTRELYASAATVLNLILLERQSLQKELLLMIRKLLSGRSIRELLSTRLSTIFLDTEEHDSEAENRLCEVQIEGTVWDIVKARNFLMDEEELSDYFNTLVSGLG